MLTAPSIKCSEGCRPTLSSSKFVRIVFFLTCGPGIRMRIVATEMTGFPLLSAAHLRARHKRHETRGRKYSFPIGLYQQWSRTDSRALLSCRHDETSYCSVDCQRAHWKDHKDDCAYYTKMRRRKCVVCGASRKYSDPPFPVCACGERCYCDERCQEIDWQVGTARSTITARSRPHSETCASGYLYLEG